MQAWLANPKQLATCVEVVINLEGLGPYRARGERVIGYGERMQMFRYYLNTYGKLFWVEVVINLNICILPP